jgi:2-keto-3-deoxy-6-phosphogluconate aldolase
MAKNKLVTYDRLAPELGVAPRTVRTWVSQGKISCFRIGHRTVLFDPAKAWQEITAFEKKAVTSRGNKSNTP